MHCTWCTSLRWASAPDDDAGDDDDDDDDGDDDDGDDDEAQKNTPLSLPPSPDKHKGCCSNRDAF